MNDGYRDFDIENSKSSLKEQSPIHSLDNLAVDGHGNDRESHYHGNRRATDLASKRLGASDGKLETQLLTFFKLRNTIVN